MLEPKPILLVEDDDVDIMTIRRAFRKGNLRQELVVVNNGEEALDYLQDPNTLQPDVILLDLNMPLMDGVTFLRIVKRDPELRKIPVVILTSSEEDQDRFETFDLSVAGYLLKPVEFAQFVHTLQVLTNYWQMSHRA